MKSGKWNKCFVNTEWRAVALEYRKYHRTVPLVTEFNRKPASKGEMCFAEITAQASPKCNTQFGPMRFVSYIFMLNSHAYVSFPILGYPTEKIFKAVISKLYYMGNIMSLHIFCEVN